MFFLTPHKKYRIIVKVHKTNKEGEIIQEPVHAVFEDGVFDTKKRMVGMVEIDEQELIEFITSRPNFGVDFYAAPNNKIPETHGYQGNKVGIAKMDKTPVEENTLEKTVQEMGKQISNLGNIVKSLVESQGTKTKDVDKPEPEASTDDKKEDIEKDTETDK